MSLINFIANASIIHFFVWCILRSWSRVKKSKVQRCVIGKIDPGNDASNCIIPGSEPVMMTQNVRISCKCGFRYWSVMGFGRIEFGFQASSDWPMSCPMRLWRLKSRPERSKAWDRSDRSVSGISEAETDAIENHSVPCRFWIYWLTWWESVSSQLN